MKVEALMEVVREEPNPEHGRPRILTIKGKQGTLGVHVERDTGTLYLFAIGPMGGDRGTVVVSARRAHELKRWLGQPAGTRLYAGDGFYFWRRIDADGGVWIHIGKLTFSSKSWRLAVDEAADEALRECLTAWVEQATAHRVDESVELRVLVKLDADAPVPHEELAEAVKNLLEAKGWKNDAGFVVIDEVTVS